MESLKKYLLLAFLIENMMAQVPAFHSISEATFYIFLGVGAVMAFDSENWSSSSLAKFRWMYLLMAIYLFYEFVIGNKYISGETLKYLAAKFSTFFIMLTSLNHAYEFYEKKLAYIIGIILSFFVVYGIVSGGGFQDGGDERISLGFVNSNSTGAYGAIISGVVMFHTRDNEFDWKCRVLLLIGFLATLAAGSRAGFLALFLYMFLRYGISVKTVSVVALLLCLGLVILPNIGIETVGLQRLYNTITGVEGSNRDVEREAGIWMIQQNPWRGWGFGSKNQGYALTLSQHGSHNGYIDTARDMGLPTAIIWFLCVIVPTVSFWWTKVRYGLSTGFFFATVVILFVKSMYEGLFTGVHELETNLFFVALAIVTAKNHQIKYDQDNQYS